jgi:cell division protein FtsQ
MIAVGLAGRAGPIERAPEGLVQLVLAGSAAIGFSVGDIMVEGRETTAPETILEALAAGRGTPIFGVDLERAKERLEALPWVRSATVVRRLPDTLYVRLAERAPLALWQHDGKIELIDRDGGVIPVRRLDRFAKLPLVVGTDAAGHAAELLAMLATEPELALRVTAAVRVGGRRWDLHLDDAVDVMLPETGAAEAWSRLAQLERTQKLLERQIERVDLRLPDRLVLRLPPQPQPAAEAKKGRQTAKNI